MRVEGRSTTTLPNPATAAVQANVAKALAACPAAWRVPKNRRGRRLFDRSREGKAVAQGLKPSNVEGVDDDGSVTMTTPFVMSTTHHTPPGSASQTPPFGPGSPSPTRPSTKGKTEIRVGVTRTVTFARVDPDPYSTSDVVVDGDTVSWSYVWINEEGKEFCATGNDLDVNNGGLIVELRWGVGECT